VAVVGKTAPIFAVSLMMFGGSTTPALAQNVSQAGGQSSPEMYWNHNGSKMKLVAQGSSRKFYYSDPRPEIVDAGAKPGFLLFEGKSINGRYIGKAYLVNRRCGQISYNVSGPILDDYRRVELEGQKPRVDNNCRVIGAATDTLTFELVEPAVAAEGMPPMPGTNNSASTTSPSIASVPMPGIPKTTAPSVPKSTPTPTTVPIAPPQDDPFITDCDAYAANDSDPQRKGTGLPFDKVNPSKAIPACVEALSSYPNTLRFQYQLGRAYEKNGEYSEAVSWYRKAAERGNAAAQYSLGIMYANGRGVLKDSAQAATWYRKAAAQGFGTAPSTKEGGGPQIRTELEAKNIRQKFSKATFSFSYLRRR
jgi:hypothetical protein